MAGQFGFGEEGYALPVRCITEDDASKLEEEVRAIGVVTSTQTVDFVMFNVIGDLKNRDEIRMRVKMTAVRLGLEPHPSVLADEALE